MTIPTSQPIPEDNGSPARRRRERRQLAPPNASQRAAFLDRLSERSIPSFDFFVFCFLAGLVLAAAALLDSPALLVLAALVTPCLTPVTGLSLAAIVGSGRFFLLTLACTLLAAALFFLGGLAGGLAGHLLPAVPLVQIPRLVEFSWPNVLLLAVGVVLTIAGMVRSDNKPAIPSVAIAYALCLPAGLAGFGLARGVEVLWPDGLIVFAVFLTGSILLGTLTLAVLGFKPLTLFGYTLGTTIAITSLTVLIGLSGLPAAFKAEVPVTIPTFLVLPSQTPRPSPTTTLTPTITPTFTLAPTLTPTHTLVPTRTPTITATLAPTPVWASVFAPNNAGALIRSEPVSGSKIVGSVLNNVLVQILPEVEKSGSITWVHIRTLDGLEGWIVQSLLITATPAPAW